MKKETLVQTQNYFKANIKFKCSAWHYPKHELYFRSPTSIVFFILGLCDIIYLAEYDDEFWDSCLRRNLKLINNMVQACGQWEIVDRLVLTFQIKNETFKQVNLKNEL